MVKSNLSSKQLNRIEKKTCSFNSLCENGLESLGSAVFCFTDNDKESIMIKKNSAVFPVGSGIICGEHFKREAGLKIFRKIIMINLCSSGTIKLSRPKICVCVY